MGTTSNRKPLIVEFSGELVRRLKYPTLAILAVLAMGTVGYYVLGGGAWTWLNAFYMTSITLTTIGYGEILALDRAGRAFTLVLIWSGYGVFLYATATVTAYFVENNPARLIRERLMEQRIEDLRDHYIVCGSGESSLHILRELHTTRRHSVLVTTDPAALQDMSERFDTVSSLRGDPTDEAVLKQAGLQRAKGVFAVMGDDGKNMLITVLARYDNPDIKLVAECRDNSLVSKFQRAGADYVVNPMYIGALRMASEMIRPQVVTFLDRMLREQSTTRVEQVTIGSFCSLDGKTLAEAAVFEHTGLVPIALEKPDGTVVFNPGPEELLTAKTALVVIGSPEQVAKLQTYCTVPEAPHQVPSPPNRERQ